jgi:L-arabinonolactonase
MQEFELVARVDCQNQLGEGVQWNSHSQSFWWTDILSKKLFQYQLTNKTLTEWDLPDRLGCFAFTAEPQQLLCAFASGIAYYSLIDGACQWLAKPEYHWRGNRLNDGRCDRQGRFWVGSITEHQHSPNQSAGLFCVDAQGYLSQHLSGLKISNALCWNLDSSKIYHADSPSHSIHVYDFDNYTGRLSNQQLFVQLESGIEPDGATVDAENCLWNAQWGGARVIRYRPDATEDCRLVLPVTCPTCVAFGGDDYSLLAITSARVGLTPEQLQQQSQAGSLFIFKTPFKGVKESVFGVG